MRQQRHSWVIAAALAGAGLGLLSCVPDGPSGLPTNAPNDGTPAPPAPPVGAITAGVSVDGLDLPDSVSIRLNGAQMKRLPPTESVTWTDVEPGDHLVELSDLPDNCVSEGSNPRLVSVASGGLAIALFEVMCSARLGANRVQVSTTGEDPDEDGYEVRVDGDGVELRVQVGTNADLAFPNLQPGAYRVMLRDVDKDCDLAGDDRHDVEIDAGEQVDVEFRVECDD